jgi:hypothetical protein
MCKLDLLNWFHQVETARTHLVHPLTFGNFEVEEILGWNEASGMV